MQGLKIIIVIFFSLYLLGGLILYAFQERMLFLPEPLERNHRYAFEQSFKELDLEMSDGAIINMLHFEVSQARGLIVYFHGNAGNLVRWGEVVLPFVEMGYEVLISDYRGYGKSTGTRTEEKLLSDADEIYHYAKGLRSEDQIVLFGRSLGSAFASFLAGKNNPKAVILETPFYSLTDVANHIMPIYPTARLLKYRFKNHQYLANADADVFIFHGTDDEVVPYASGKKLHKAIGTRSQMITVVGGYHNNLAEHEHYWEELQKVLLNE